MKQTLLFSSPATAEIVVIVTAILVLLIILILMRKVYLWYTGIAELIVESTKQTKLLEEIRKELMHKNLQS